MKILQLTTIVRDVQTATMVAHSFTRSPVMVGRQHGNHLRLDARMVSRRHGAFLFSKDGLQFIDYHSANGTSIDGIQIPANRPFDVRTSSVITIAPFQIVAQVNLVNPHLMSTDPNATTPTVALLPRVAAPLAHPRNDGVEASPAILRATSGRDASELLERATRVIELVAEQLLASGSRMAESLSPLRLARSPEEIIALLLDRAGGDQRLRELRALLTELLRSRLTSVP